MILTVQSSPLHLRTVYVDVPANRNQHVFLRLIFGCILLMHFIFKYVIYFLTYMMLLCIMLPSLRKGGWRYGRFLVVSAIREGGCGVQA